MNKTLKKTIAFLLMICILTASMLSCSLFERETKSDDQPFVGKLSEQATWLNEANADNVIRVGVLDITYGIALTTLMDCYYSTTDSEIISFIDFYKNIEVEEVSSSEIKDVIGGGGKNLEFTYADGSIKTIYKTQGCFIIDSQVFKLKAADDFDYKSNFDRYHKMSYDKLSNVFTNTEEPQLVGETDAIADFRFKAIEADEDAYLSATHYIELGDFKIYILSETEFCLHKVKSVKYYELIEGQTFSDFITVKSDTSD